MIKFNSAYSKLFFNMNKSSFFSAGISNQINSKLEFNKFSFKNFYFQESKHGAGDVRLFNIEII